MKKVAARYIGEYPVVLKEGQGRLMDGYNKPLTSNLLNPGDTLMLPDTELLGQTYKRRMKGDAQPEFLGAGRIILPEHAGCGEEELALLGYEFHEGRSDFTPLSLDALVEPTSTKAKRSSPSTLSEV